MAASSNAQESSTNKPTCPRCHHNDKVYTTLYDDRVRVPPRSADMNYFRDYTLFLRADRVDHPDDDDSARHARFRFSPDTVDRHIAYHDDCFYDLDARLDLDKMNIDSDASKTEPSSITNQTIEELFGLTSNQLELLRQECPILALESLKREFILAQQRPSRMILIARYSLGFGCSVGFSMDISRRDVSERFCVHLLGGMNGYDSLQRDEDFCNQEPTKLYHFDDCLEIFREDKQIIP